MCLKYECGMMRTNDAGVVEKLGTLVLSGWLCSGLFRYVAWDLCEGCDEWLRKLQFNYYIALFN